MAQSEQIKSKDLIQDGVFQPTIDQANELKKVMDDLVEAFKKTYVESAKLLKSPKSLESSKEIKDTVSAIDQVTKKRQEYNKVEKEAMRIKAEADKASRQAQKEAERIAERQRKDAEKVAKEREKAARAAEKEAQKQAELNREYNKASARLNQLRKDYKDLAVAGKATTDQAKALLEEIQGLDKQLKEIDASVGQFNREVGNYSNKVEEAIQKSGLFGGILGKVTQLVELYEGALIASKIAQAESTLATTGDVIAHERNIAAIAAEEAATQKLSLAKRALNAITSPTGLIIAGAAALIALGKALYDVNQGLQDSVEIGKAITKDAFWGTGDQFKNLTINTINFRKEINGLNESLQKLRDEEQDLLFVYQDETRALNEREKALSDYNTARQKALEAEINIAKREKQLADDALKAEESRRGVGRGKALQEFYTKASEAAQKLFEVEDKYNDFISLELPKSERQLFDQRIINEIELLRSKKLGADSAVEILKKQVTDEKSILADRQAALDTLKKAQAAAFEEEISLLQKFGLTRKELDKLISTNDALALQRQIVQLGKTKLNVEQQTELAKVVLEIQKARLDNDSQQAAIEDKRIQNLKEIARLQTEIRDVEYQREIYELQLKIVDNQQKSEILRQKSLTKTNLFRLKYSQNAILATKKENDTVIELQEEQEKQVKLTAQRQVDAIREEVKNRKKEKDIAANEIKLIEEKLVNDVQKIQTDSLKTQSDNEKKLNDYIKQLRTERITSTLQELSQVTSAFGEELDKRRQLQDQAAQAQLSKTESNLEKQQALAERGLDNSLAFQEERLNKLELKRRDAQEKAQREQEAIDTVNNFNSFLQARLKQLPPPTDAQAISGALADTLFAKGIAKGLVQFAAEGNNMIEGAGTETSDSIPFMLSKNEAVIKASENKKHNEAVRSLNAGKFDQEFVPRYEFEKRSQNVGVSSLENILLQSNKKMDVLIKEIREKPVTSFDVDRFGNFVEKVYQSGMKTVITHQKARPRI